MEGTTLMQMETFALNSAVDTRRWAKTEVSPLREGLRPNPPAPTREEEQRYNQTAPRREEREEPQAKEDDGG
jgi:hypothetical protein